MPGKRHPIRRRLRTIVCAVGLLLWAAGVPTALLQPAAAQTVAQRAMPGSVSESLSEQRQRVLLRMVRQDCGSCHGMHLTGGLGPALLPDTLRETPRESLIATVMHGRPGTPMPPWGPMLTQTEASWVIDQLLAGMPAEAALASQGARNASR